MAQGREERVNIPTKTWALCNVATAHYAHRETQPTVVLSREVLSRDSGDLETPVDSYMEKLDVS